MVEIREYKYPFQKDNTELEVEILNAYRHRYRYGLFPYEYLGFGQLGSNSYLERSEHCHML